MQIHKNGHMTLIFDLDTERNYKESLMDCYRLRNHTNMTQTKWEMKQTRSKPAEFIKWPNYLTVDILTLTLTRIMQE